MYQPRSAVMSLYYKWMKTATQDEIQFVDAVFEIGEDNYDGGGDVLVETYDPEEILNKINDLNHAREIAGLWVEQNLNARWGADDDPQVAMSNKHRKWKKKKKAENLKNPRPKEKRKTDDIDLKDLED